MAVKLCALCLWVATLQSESGLTEALRRLGSITEGRLPIAPPSSAPSSSQTLERDPFRWSLPLPYKDDPETVEESLELYELGLKRDPCITYCASDVDQDAIRNDCKDMVEAIVFLARNNHPKVRPECATAKRPMCDYDCLSWGHRCRFTVEVSDETCFGTRTKEKRFRLRHCLSTRGRTEK